MTDGHLSVSRAAVLYIGALLGPGLLVLPGLAAAEAGPASIVAWAALLVVSGLLAIVFAALGVGYPGAGGVRGYAAAGLGAWAGRAVGWCFLGGIVTGAPLVCIVGGGYLAELVGAGSGVALAGAGVLLVTVLAITFGGVRTSSAVQLALVGLLLAIVVVAVVGSARHAHAGNWSPFAPHGWSAVGSAASVLMFSFVGWEAIAPLTSRLARPRRELPRVIAIAFVVSSVVYLALAAVVVAVLGRRAASAVPLAGLLGSAIGPAGHTVAALAAVVLTLGCTNAYLAGAGSLARALVEPRPGERRSDTLPSWLVVIILLSGATIIGLAAAHRVEVAGLLAVPTAFFLAVYLGCTTAAVRLLRGPLRAVSAGAAACVVAVLAFSGWALVPAVVVIVLAAALPRAARPVLRGAPPAHDRATTAAEGAGRPPAILGGMCGRYVSVKSDADLSDEFDAIDATNGEWSAPDYNVAPTKPVRIVVNRPLRDEHGTPATTATRQLRVVSWGLVPSWAKDRSTQGRMFNARAESVASTNAFRRAYAKRRCLVPSDGWYEWRVVDGGPKQPMYMVTPDGHSLAFAGLYEFWGERGQTITTCTIVTAAAAGELTAIHDRMPLVLPRAAWARWLDPAVEDPAELLAPWDEAAGEHLELRPVATLVNKVDNNGAQLLARAEPRPAEQRLF